VVCNKGESLEDAIRRKYSYGNDTEIKIMNAFDVQLNLSLQLLYLPTSTPLAIKDLAIIIKNLI